MANVRNLEGGEYLAVYNIPRCIHSKNLRNFFSHFVESFGFHCFHYIHRPEIQKQGNSYQAFFTPDDLSLVSNRKLKRVGQRSKKEGPYTNCCIIVVKKTRVKDFFRLYKNKYWINDVGETVNTQCYISRIKVQSKASLPHPADDSEISASESSELRNGPPVKDTFIEEDLKQLREMNPPAEMPHGNVGTPTIVFFHLLQMCKLPPHIIKKLDLVFPRNRGKRLYGSVFLQYDKTDNNTNKKFKNKYKSPVLADFMRFESSEEISDVSIRGKDYENAAEADDEDGEEVVDYEPEPEDRKERLFEERIELPWEKGGSGLVFYTDAQYWDAKKGDFDERTADDWDIDMSAYYNTDGVDKDASDLMQIRKEKMLRGELSDDDNDNSASDLMQIRKEMLQGELSDDDDASLDSSKLGSFEKFTKGIGRKLLEKQGWKDGQGLGRSGVGIPEPVKCTGQKTRERKGLGYLGEKLPRFIGQTQQMKKKRRETDILISTVYDNIDAPDTVEKFSLPNVLSYRKKFVKENPETQS